MFNKKANLVLSFDERKKFTSFVILLSEIAKRNKKEVKNKKKSKTKPRYKKKGLVIKNYEPISYLIKIGLHSKTIGPPVAVGSTGQ